MDNRRIITCALYKGRCDKRESVKRVSEIIKITEESIKKGEETGMINARSLFKLLDYYGLQIKVYDKFGNPLK